MGAPDRIDPDRRRSIAALVLTGLGMVVFIGFHFVEYQGDAGWAIWLELWDILRYPSDIDAQVAVIVAGFVCMSMLSVCAPFLRPILEKSRLARLLLGGLSLLSALILGYFLVTGPNRMLFLLTLASALTTTGILLVPAERPREPMP
jgi:hypothetical protein